MAIKFKPKETGERQERLKAYEGSEGGVKEKLLLTIFNQSSLAQNLWVC